MNFETKMTMNESDAIDRWILIAFETDKYMRFRENIEA